jgi:DNA-binding transcriptional MerR regulator
MHEKNMDFKALTIGDFAELVGLTVPTLRYYDNIGIFQADQHGINLKNHYRYYSSDQITAVKMVRVLSGIGVGLETIGDLVQKRTPEQLLKILQTHRNKMHAKMREMEETHAIIETFMDLLYEGISATEETLFLAERPETHIILGHKNNFIGETGFLHEFIRFCTLPHEPRINVSLPIGGYFDNMSSFLSNPSSPSRFFSLDNRGNEKWESGLYLTGYTRGNYGNTNDLSERMNAYARKNGLMPKGPVYNQYLFDELSIVDPTQYLLRASVSVIERHAHSKRYRE